MLFFLLSSIYLYNASLGVVAQDTIDFSQVEFEDDVWVGHNAIITPSVRKIGRGSVIAAGAVVTKDVPRYAIVAGNPAVVIKYRFSMELIEKVEQSKWWLEDKPYIEQLIGLNSPMLFSPETYFFNENEISKNG